MRTNKDKSTLLTTIQALREKENKLTPTEAALYLGQECIYNGKLKGVVGTATIYDLSQDEIEVGVKLLLRPLSSITEEEAIRFVELSYGNGIYNFRLNGTYAQWSMYHGDYDNDFDINFDEMFFFKPEAFTYLLSCGFDLFGHLESGKALDKTKQV